jgi:fucose permease
LHAQAAVERAIAAPQSRNLQPVLGATDAVHAAATAEIAPLVRHAEYLRQINGNKAFVLQRRNRVMTIVTVVVAAAISFVGFAGTDKLHDQLQSVLGWSKQAIEISYNCLILAVLLLTIVALIYRLPERAAQHERAIELVTQASQCCSNLLRHTVTNI